MFIPILLSFLGKRFPNYKREVISFSQLRFFVLVNLSQSEPLIIKSDLSFLVAINRKSLPFFFFLIQQAGNSDTSKRRMLQRWEVTQGRLPSFFIALRSTKFEPAL